jgi:hypothetical protein
MKSLLAVPLIVLGITNAAWAQDETPVSKESVVSHVSTASEPLPDANNTDAAMPQSRGLSLLSVATPRTGLAALSFSNSLATDSLAASVSSSSPLSSPPPSSPAPAKPAPPSPTPYGFNERDYNLEIALGISVVRFRSPAYYATGVGFHSAAAFFFKDWLAVEGAVTTFFAPTIFAGEHIKFVSYGAGPKISFGRSRLEPWVHVLSGGAHVVPQTALGGKNGFEVTAGAGVDYGLNPRVSLRLEGDYLGTRFFSQWQNSGQGIAAIVIHF